jgi:peptidoglycan/xylan/chitin deacetylase (PgdA/CDA1 family)
MRSILLSFDIEEFDMPLEYGRSISFQEQIRVSKEGTERILEILSRHKVKATFFSTVVFASEAQDLITRIVRGGHELGSHSYFHSKFEDADLSESRKELQNLSGSRVHGFRMPRMMPVSDDLLQSAGYQYNASLNPTWIPGRYNNLKKSRTVFTENGLVQLPASVTPLFRFPLFWLSFHNIPITLYKLMCKRTINRDHYLNLYFHPWEFTDLATSGLPPYVKRNSGQKMIDRFSSLIRWMQQEGYSFLTIEEFLSSKNG